MAAWILLLVGVAGGGALPRCDLVEINHYMPEDQSGFTQLIAWDWDASYCRWNAQQWMIVRSWSRCGDVLTGVGDSGEVRVSSRLFRETWTRYDPERRNVLLFEQQYRRRVW